MNDIHLFSVSWATSFHLFPSKLEQELPPQSIIWNIMIGASSSIGRWWEYLAFSLVESREWYQWIIKLVDNIEYPLDIIQPPHWRSLKSGRSSSEEDPQVDIELEIIIEIYWFNILA